MTRVSPEQLARHAWHLVSHLEKALKNPDIWYINATNASNHVFRL